MSDLWTEKYRPKKISDIIGNEDNISTIVKWITDFKNNVKGTPKVLLISGEPGIGKTSTAHVILNEYGYDIIEHNASDIRGKKSMDIIVKRSLEYTNIMDLMSGCAKPVAIILDEIDNLVCGGSEKGGMSEFVDIIKMDVDLNLRSTKKKIKIYNPIICVYNEFSHKQLKDLKKYAVSVKFESPTQKNMMDLLNRVANGEGMNIEEKAKSEMVKISENDIRRLFIILESVNRFGHELITYDIVERLASNFAHKNKAFFIYKEIFELLTEKLPFSQSLEIFRKDGFKVPMYIYENCLKFVNCKDIDNKNKLDMYYNILENLARCDSIQTIIFLNHYTELNKYCGVLSCGEVNNIMSKAPNKKTILNKTIDVSSLNTKISQIGSNRKMVRTVAVLLKHVDIDMDQDTLCILSEFFCYHLFDSGGSLETLAKYMKLKGIEIDDINHIVKVRKFNTIKSIRSKKLTTKQIKELEKYLADE